MAINEAVLKIISERGTPWSDIKKRKNKWIRNVLRHDELLRLFTEDSVEGTNYKERQVTGKVLLPTNVRIVQKM